MPSGSPVFSLLLWFSHFFSLSLHNKPFCINMHIFSSVSFPLRYPNTDEGKGIDTAITPPDHVVQKPLELIWKSLEKFGDVVKRSCRIQFDEGFWLDLRRLECWQKCIHKGQYHVLSNINKGCMETGVEVMHASFWQRIWLHFVHVLRLINLMEEILKVANV